MAETLVGVAGEHVHGLLLQVKLSPRKVKSSEIPTRKTTGIDDAATTVASLSSSSLYPWPGRSGEGRPRPVFQNNSTPGDLVLKRAFPCDDGMGSLFSASDFNHEMSSLHGTSRPERTESVQALVDHISVY
jgi:hypothetical protein